MGETSRDQFVRRLGLGKALAMVIDEAARRGTHPASIMGALMDTAVTYAHRHHRDLEAELIVPARLFLLDLRAENA
jgi:hypothetical protein